MRDKKNDEGFGAISGANPGNFIVRGTTTNVPPDDDDSDGHLHISTELAEIIKKIAEMDTNVKKKGRKSKKSSQAVARGKNSQLEIVTQALVLIEDLYVHLPLKKAMHAVNPIQQLKLLEYAVSKTKDGLDHREFYDQMLSIFTELRDLHTAYFLPDPYSRCVAFLPFLIESFYESQDSNDRKYMVSKIYRGANVPESFKKGVVITHWNGIPLEQAVKKNGEDNAGSNKAARFARGLQRMTLRPLAMSKLPEEAWVDITYLKDDGQPGWVRFEWCYTQGLPERTGSVSDAKINTKDKGDIRAEMGIHLETEKSRRMKKRFYSRKQNAKIIEEAAKERGAEYTDIQSKIPDVFSARKYKKFGYIRIWTFDVNDVNEFVTEFIRLAKELPGGGLVIDVRGNGGGLIPAGENLLQVLTSEKIQPERFHFINSPVMLKLCKGNDRWLGEWVDSIERSIGTGEVFSQGFPLSTVKNGSCAHPGAKVLITDALCYSTADIFAAGFQDNGLGAILGVDETTGAGGANVWTHDLLCEYLPDDVPLRRLPDGSQFTVAIRRATRVGKNSGVPLEDLGVRPDIRYKMSKDDLLYGNVDLIKKAASILEIRG